MEGPPGPPEGNAAIFGLSVEMIKDSKKPGFTVVEILIASGLLLTLLSLLGFLFRNNIKAGLQYADFALQQKRLAIALERVAEATRRSTLAGISHKGNVIAIQPRKTVGNDGKIVWSEHLEVFWYAGSAVWYRNLNSSQAGVALSASEPVQLTDDELSRLPLEEGGARLAFPVSSFQVSVLSDQELGIEATLERPNGFPFFRQIVLGAPE